MASVLDILLGAPITKARQHEQLEVHLRFRTPESLRLTLYDNIAHNTQKSGALLAAQAIFIVVDTYGVDHGWPRGPVLVSIFALILSALLVMINLRSIYLRASPEGQDPTVLEREALLQLVYLLSVRGARFNIALYLTFLSVILLGFGAFEGAISA